MIKGVGFDWFYPQQEMCQFNNKFLTERNNS